MKLFVRRLAAAVILCVILAGCVSCGSNAAQEDGVLKVTFLDVGKGDCILLEKDGTYVLLDAGYDGTADGVLSYLRKAGVDHLDYLVITHYDKDHVGGAAKIAQNLSIGLIYLPGYEGVGTYYTSFMDVIAQNSLPAENVTRDISFTLADVNYKLYASDLEYEFKKSDNEGNDNDVSLVIAVRLGSDSYLFAGDLEEKGIDSYLTDGLGTFDVVKLPHHGRKESNTDDFIESTQPKIAVITDSSDETADKKVIKLLDAAEAEVYCSSDCGNIIVTSTGTGEYTVNTQKAKE